MGSELEHFRSRATTLQESETSLLTKLQVKRKRIAAADRSLERECSATSKLQILS